MKGEGGGDDERWIIRQGGRGVSETEPSSPLSSHVPVPTYNKKQQIYATSFWQQQHAHGRVQVETLEIILLLQLLVFFIQ